MTGGDAVAILCSFFVKLSLYKTNTWSSESMHVPPTSPVTHRSGKGLGQKGSSWNFGVPGACWPDSTFAAFGSGFQTPNDRLTSAVFTATQAHVVLFIVLTFLSAEATLRLWGLALNRHSLAYLIIPTNPDAEKSGTRTSSPAELECELHLSGRGCCRSQQPRNSGRSAR